MRQGGVHQGGVHQGGVHQGAGHQGAGWEEERMYRNVLNSPVQWCPEGDYCAKGRSCMHVHPMFQHLREQAMIHMGEHFAQMAQQGWM